MLAPLRGAATTTVSQAKKKWCMLANYFLDGVSELFLDSAVLERPAETSVVIITKNGPAVAISMKLPMLAPLRGAVSYTINRLM